MAIHGLRVGRTGALRPWSPALVIACAFALSATVLAMLVPYDGLPDWGHVVSVLALAVTYLAVIVSVAVLIDERSRLIDQLQRLQIEAAADRARHEAADSEHARQTEQLQRRLVHSSKMRAVGELSAAVAHGVNNPLTGVLGYAELLLADWPAGDPRRADVETIRNEALRARGIVRALVDFSRPRDPERRLVDLRETLVTTIDLIRYHIERRGITIVQEFGAVEPFEVDPGAIQQVVLDLCQNAVQAMPSGGELRVGLRTEDREAVIVITDTGVGMDASVAERAFQPFFTTRDDGLSNGLGLSVGRELIEAHGGTLTLSSRPGAGTSVEIRLPLELAPVDEADEVAAPAISPLAVG
jgi:signal transduction histidine kinase